MSGDKNTWWRLAWAVLTALAAMATVLAAMAIVGGAGWWVIDTRFPDTALPTPRLEALPDDRKATLKLELDAPDAPDDANVEWQYEQRYAEREGEYTSPTSPDRWRSLPEDRVVTGLTNGWGYVFRVRAVRGGKQGRPSNDATVTPTAVPARLDEIAALIRALRRDIVTPEQWQAAASRLAAAIEQGFENLTRVTDDRGAESAGRLAVLRQSVENLSLPATDQQLAAIEERLAGIERVLTVAPPPTVSDEQLADLMKRLTDTERVLKALKADPPSAVTDERWTDLMKRLTAIATHLETISRRMPPRAEDEAEQEQPSPTAPARAPSSPSDETDRGATSPDRRDSTSSDTPASTGPSGETEQEQDDQDQDRETIPRALTPFKFPNARLVDGVPVGTGVTVPEQEVNQALASLGACAREGAPVTVKPYGFASKAPFRRADGTPMERSDALNLKTANLRARNVYDALREGATAYPHVRVEDPHEWPSLEEMTLKRDDGSLITYPEDEQDHEGLRRVVVLEVLAPGGCTFE